MRHLSDSGIQRAQPAYLQIEQLVRAAIQSGELPCGSRVPTVRTLAEQYQTSIFTIQTALKSLARDGLLERTRRRGTFVTASSTKLSRLAIYFGVDFWHREEMGFYRILYERLAAELDCRHVKHELWVETRPQKYRDKPLPGLVASLSSQAHQGMIAVATNEEETNWISKQGIPFATHGVAPKFPVVGTDNAQMISMALQSLKDDGCQTAGMITPPDVFLKDPNPSPDYKANHAECFKTFASLAAIAGLTTQDSWLCLPDKWLRNWEHEEFGYRKFLEIWRQPERPDGLIIFPDTIAKGAITAILSEAVAVPKDLKLVFHRNEGRPVLCPLEASWLVTDVGKIAESLIGLLETQLSGLPAKSIIVPYGFERSVPQNASTNSKIIT